MTSLHSVRAQKIGLSIFIILITIILFIPLWISHTPNPISRIPIVAIANYGPHASLQSSIEGIKETLYEQGFIENQSIHYEIMDVNFDTNLIPQMIARIKLFSPTVIVAMTTPVAQFAKHSIQNIPLIYTVITDPVSAGLLSSAFQSENNITGSSDQQNLTLLIEFARAILPKANNIGMLYAPSEANDLALVKMMQKAAQKANMQVMAIPIDHVRDMSIRMQQLKGQVDFIYVGSSGPILPALPAIAKSADKMGIPIFNVEPSAVESGLVLASFGVDYKQVGKNAGILIAQVLKQKKVADLSPIYPTQDHHHAYLNAKKAKALGLLIPKNFPQLTIVESSP